MNKNSTLVFVKTLQWFGHLERIEENAWPSKCRTLPSTLLKTSFSRGRLWKIWKISIKVIRNHLKERKLSTDLAK